MGTATKLYTMTVSLMCQHAEIELSHRLRESILCSDKRRSVGGGAGGARTKEYESATLPKAE